MGLLQILFEWFIFLIAVSRAAEFTDEQAGLLATGNYDDYDHKYLPQVTDKYNNAGISAFKNPNAPVIKPQRLPIHISRPTSVQIDQPYYDYRDENSDIPSTPSQIESKQIPPPNNSPPNNYPPNNYPPKTPNTTNPYDPQEYNYHYEKVEDSDPNHITAVHREAHQSAFKYDNTDNDSHLPTNGQQPPSNNQVPFNYKAPSNTQPLPFNAPSQSNPEIPLSRPGVRPVGFFQQGAPNGFNRRYPNQIPSNQRSDMTLYPNPQINNPDINTQYQPNSANKMNSPQGTEFLGGDGDELLSNSNFPSHESDSHNGPYFQDFLKRFKFFPRTAARW